MDNPIILKIKNLTKIYRNSNKGIKNINLEIEKGKFYGLIGPNGAGKTTLIKSIVGVYSSANYLGEIFLNDKLINEYDIGESKKIGYVPEKANFPKWFKVIDYLTFILQLDFLQIKNSSLIQKIQKIAKELNWDYLLKRNIASLSSGESKKILILQAFIANPEIIIMDEPNDNLDPDTRIQVLNYCKKQCQRGLTVVISSHVLFEIENFIDEAIYIFDGSLQILKKEKNEISYILQVDNHASLANYLLKNKINFREEDSKFYLIFKNQKNKKETLSWIIKQNIDIKYLQKRTNSLLDNYHKLREDQNAKNKR